MVIGKVCSDKWRLCYPVIPLWVYIAVSIFIIILFTILGWIMLKDRRDNYGRDNKDR